MTELARKLRADVGTVQREVARLERAGILRSERIGKTRLVRANVDSVLYRPLAELVLRAFGPAEVVAQEFVRIRGIQDLFIFGSWAARYEGLEGPAPVDVDVLVIGSPNRDEVYEAALRAERRLGREVNATVRSREAWEGKRDGFVRQVRSSPIVHIDRETHVDG